MTKNRKTKRLVPNILWVKFMLWAKRQRQDQLIGDGSSPESHEIQRKYLALLQTPNRLTPKQYRRMVDAKGWPIAALSQRWGHSRNWTYQMIANPFREQLWDDAARGLPDFDEKTHDEFMAQEPKGDEREKS